MVVLPEEVLLAALVPMGVPVVDRTLVVATIVVAGRVLCCLEVLTKGEHRAALLHRFREWVDQ